MVKQYACMCVYVEIKGVCLYRVRETDQTVQEILSKLRTLCACGRVGLSGDDRGVLRDKQNSQQCEKQT